MVKEPLLGKIGDAGSVLVTSLIQRDNNRAFSLWRCGSDCLHGETNSIRGQV